MTPVEEDTRLEPRYDGAGLIPVIAQHVETGEVLMLAHMNAEALRRTIESGEAHYWSRSRQRLWHKGETSGNVQKVVELRIDCDQDSILMRVRPEGSGVACHTGRKTCFYRVIEGDRLRLDKE